VGNPACIVATCALNQRFKWGRRGNFRLSARRRTCTPCHYSVPGVIYYGSRVSYRWRIPQGMPINRG